MSILVIRNSTPVQPRGWIDQAKYEAVLLADNRVVDFRNLDAAAAAACHDRARIRVGRRVKRRHAGTVRRGIAFHVHASLIARTRVRDEEVPGRRGLGVGPRVIGSLHDRRDAARHPEAVGEPVGRHQREDNGSCRDTRDAPTVQPSSRRRWDIRMPRRRQVRPGECQDFRRRRWRRG